MTALSPRTLMDHDFADRTCLVVGHGFSANRRVAAMEALGASVTLVSCHGYRPGMAAGFDAVITCDRRVDESVLADALDAGVPVHVVGRPERSTFGLSRQALRALAP